MSGSVTFRGVGALFLAFGVPACVMVRIISKSTKLSKHTKSGDNVSKRGSSFLRVLGELRDLCDVASLPTSKTVVVLTALVINRLALVSPASWDRSAGCEDYVKAWTS
jgi:hypothetical protein